MTDKNGKIIRIARKIMADASGWTVRGIYLVGPSTYAIWREKHN